METTAGGGDILQEEGCNRDQAVVVSEDWWALTRHIDVLVGHEESMHS